MPTLRNTPPHYLQLGERRLPIVIRKHKTARRLVLRYQPLSGSISLTIPRYVTINQGLHFVNEKREWLFAQVMQFSHDATFHDGMTLPVLGEQVTIMRHDGRGTSALDMQQQQLHLYCAPEFVARRAREALSKHLLEHIRERSAHYATLLGVRVRSIRLRDTRSRWGSCSTQGNLSFSWRLVFAPYEVLDYVVAHEVAHIAHHDHSPQFWATVERLMPSYANHRDWLAAHGRELYRYGTP
jgi:predicted metal-dependent hydrolase